MTTPLEADTLVETESQLRPWRRLWPLDVSPPFGGVLDAVVRLSEGPIMLNVVSPVSSSFPMTAARPGTSVVVASLTMCETDAHRLREMGFHEGRCVRVVLAADPLICQMDRSRVGLSRRLAAHIMVYPAAEARPLP